MAQTMTVDDRDSQINYSGSWLEGGTQGLEQDGYVASIRPS